NFLDEQNIPECSATRAYYASLLKQSQCLNINEFLEFDVSEAPADFIQEIENIRQDETAREIDTGKKLVRALKDTKDNTEYTQSCSVPIFSATFQKKRPDISIFPDDVHDESKYLPFNIVTIIELKKRTKAHLALDQIDVAQLMEYLGMLN
ncbi:unnamed protein product, partial [Didymodactylos carnosus]